MKTLKCYRLIVTDDWGRLIGIFRNNPSWTYSEALEELSYMHETSRNFKYRGPHAFTHKFWSKHEELFDRICYDYDAQLLELSIPFKAIIWQDDDQIVINPDWYNQINTEEDMWE